MHHDISIYNYIPTGNSWCSLAWSCRECAWSWTTVVNCDLEQRHGFTQSFDILGFGIKQKNMNSGSMRYVSPLDRSTRHKTEHAVQAISRSLSRGTSSLHTAMPQLDWFLCGLHQHNEDGSRYTNTLGKFYMGTSFFRRGKFADYILNSHEFTRTNDNSAKCWATWENTSFHPPELSVGFSDVVIHWDPSIAGGVVPNRPWAGHAVGP